MRAQAVAPAESRPAATRPMSLSCSMLVGRAEAPSRNSAVDRGWKISGIAVAAHVQGAGPSTEMRFMQFYIDEIHIK